MSGTASPGGSASSGRTASSGERPRDRLGRPVAPGDPRAVEAAPLPDPPTTAAVIAAAEAFLAAGMPWHAHECFEAAWRTAPEGSDERAAWRALAQWGAALTHAARGNPAGAASVGARAAAGLAAAAASGVRLRDGEARPLDLAALAASTHPRPPSGGVIRIPGSLPRLEPLPPA